MCKLFHKNNIINRQITINQHYVPQLYLKQFQAGNKCIWSFDRDFKTVPVRPKAIKSAASSDYYYDLPATLDRKSLKFFQRVDKDITKIEEIGKNFLFAIIKGVSPLIGQQFAPEKYAPPSERLYRNMACYIALQFLRTEAARILVRVSLKHLTEIEIEKLINDMAPGLDMSGWRVNENWIKYYHILQIYNFLEYEDYFLKKIWRFGINSTNIPLWTSDNPVAIQSLIPSSVRPDLEEYGVRIAFPLSPDSVLLMHDPTHYKYMSALEGKPLLLSANDVQQLNELQFNQCARYIFSSQPFDQNHVDELIKRREEKIASSEMERRWVEALMAAREADNVRTPIVTK